MFEIQRLHDECLQLDVDSLRGQKFNNICLHRCILDDLDFHGSTLADIDFRSAEMNRTRFASTVICNSKLIMVKARHAVFDTSTFCDSMMLHSDFSGSSFKDADLSKNIIKNVLFANCDFRGANLSCKGFETCVLTGAIFDERTVWHEEFDAIEYGAIKV